MKSGITTTLRKGDIPIVPATNVVYVQPGPLSSGYVLEVTESDKPQG